MNKTVLLIGLISLGVAFNSYSNDSDRIIQLEKETEELKLRISKLERIIINLRDSQKLAPSHKGWKSVSNWRKVTKDMSPSNVQEILGEPKRVDVGPFTDWHYENNGSVRFYREKVIGWSEPR